MPTARLRTTELSLRILELVREQGGARLGEVVDRVDVSKSTVYKHLATLEANDFLVKKGGTYHISLKFLNFGEHARRREQAYEIASEGVRELTDRTNEESDFVVEEHGRIMTLNHSYHEGNTYVEDINLNDPISRGRNGTYYYMHNTASGKSILASLPESRVEEIVDRWGLPASTDATITGRDSLFDELAAVRENGYAVDDEEFTEGLRSVGQAVHYPDGRVVGALSVSGPTYRLTEIVIQDEVAPVLASTVEDIEADIAQAADSGDLWPSNDA